ncbi:MAG: hypothetical protein M0R17_10965 [Candidatus Omnitrophica bacterium]|jgi:ATP-dependent Zn protease|nr:hypothetical protein [Candidatus Omnitrophota bacterium]
MNKQLIILLSIFLLSFTSAIYVGESQVYPNTLNSDNLLYTIIDNTSYLVYPIIEVNLTNIKITIPDNSNPNSYKIVLINNESETQTIVVSSKGHSKTKIVNQTIEKIIEVPSYIENKTIEIVNQTITKTEFKEIRKPTKWTWIIGLISILLIILILIYFMKRQEKRWIKEEKENKDG